MIIQIRRRRSSELLPPSSSPGLVVVVVACACEVPFPSTSRLAVVGNGPLLAASTVGSGSSSDSSGSGEVTSGSSSGGGSVTGGWVTGGWVTGGCVVVAWVVVVVVGMLLVVDDVVTCPALDTLARLAPAPGGSTHAAAANTRHPATTNIRQHAGAVGPPGDGVA